MDAFNKNLQWHQNETLSRVCDNFFSASQIACSRQFDGHSQTLGEPRERNVSQGGGGLVSFSGGDERSEPENANSSPTLDSTATAHGKGRRASVPGGHAAAALPCLNTNNCNERKSDRSESLSSGHRKIAFALKLNVRWLIERYGLENVGFLTLTFARHIVSYKEAQQALHSLMTGVLKCRYPEYIIVMERMDSGRIHYHLLVVVAQDIRTGFDFKAVKRGNYASASDYLRREWKFWRQTAPKYGFGRTELLPIKKTAEGIAKYVGKYVAKHVGQRLAEDKGARLVRYPTREMKLLNAVVCYQTSLREKQTCGSVRSSLSAPARLVTVGSEAAETMHLTIPVWK